MTRRALAPAAAACLALLCAGRAPAEPDSFDIGRSVTVDAGVSAGEVLANLFLMPFALAMAQRHHGFSLHPYQPGQGYGRGARPVAASAWTSHLALDGGHAGHGGALRVRGANRLGWDLGFASFGRGAFGSNRRAGSYWGHITANYLQGPKALFELGLGFASFQDPDPRWGASAEAAMELFPARPFTALARYQAASLRGQGYHDLSLAGGLVWRHAGLRAGVRAFLNPARVRFGPEASAAFWF